MNHYKNVLEAIGKTGRKSTIHNMLNRTYAQTDDALLRQMVGMAISQFESTSTNTSHTPLIHMRSVKTDQLVKYCESKREGRQP